MGDADRTTHLNYVELARVDEFVDAPGQIAKGWAASALACRSGFKGDETDMW